MENSKILAVYDVRGIQEYIYKSSKLKDAQGASTIIKDLIFRALKKVNDDPNNKLKGELEWYDNNGVVKKYSDNEEFDYQLLYEGGGNAYILYKNKDIYQNVNKIMSKYIIDETYSLQLVSTFVEKTNNYSNDLHNLILELAEEKERTNGDARLGALPIVKIETNTGLPIDKRYNMSIETYKKQSSARKVNTSGIILDNLVEDKGSNSILAVVHIDGNNMSQRIFDIISEITNYEDAVYEMRKISYNIKKNYDDVFNNLSKKYNTIKIGSKIINNAIMKIVVAGDDITYVCPAKLALASVETFVKNINKKSMKEDNSGSNRFNFSVCAGIAYFDSHFPFHSAYEIAEKCCLSAKAKAKSIDDFRSPNFVDFHICKNSLQTNNFNKTRENEYITSFGERLLLRPYCIETDAFRPNSSKYHDYNNFDNFKTILDYFQDDEKISRSRSKELRNGYSLGEQHINDLITLYSSRGIKFPYKLEYSKKPYIEIFDSERGEKIKYATWYDALEILDLYDDFKEVK